jgi:hypothetical protein
MKLVTIIVGLFLSTTLFAQRIAVVEAYNILGTRDVAPYQLKIENNTWQAENVDDATPTKLYVASNGTYLQITDEGNGANKSIVQCKIVQNQNGKTIIALNTTVTTNQNEILNSIKFFEIEATSGAILKTVLPSINPLNYIAKADLAGQEELFTNGEIVYTLNEKTNDISAAAYFKTLEKDCMAGSKNACQAQNVIQPAITLVWSNQLKKYTTTKIK